MDTASLYALTINDGGATVTNGREPATGAYIVALPGAIIVPVDSYPEFADAVEAQSLRSVLIGTWVDGPRIFVDAVESYSDRDEAVRVGRERGQLAIYDQSAGKVITL